MTFGIAAYIINLQTKTPILIVGKSRLFSLDKIKVQKLTIPRKELIAILATVRTLGKLKKKQKFKI